MSSARFFQTITSSSRAYYGFAFLSGACGAGALAPFDFAPAFFVPMGAAILVLDRASHWSMALKAGWWLGFGYLLAGLWWLGAAFLVEPQFIWAMPFAVLGLPALLALFFAGGFGLAHLLWRPGLIRLVSLALALAWSEALRGVVFTGFPWNSLGMSLGSSLLLAQSASLFGVNGLNFIAVVLFAAPTLWFTEQKRSTQIAALCVSVFGFVSLAAFGAYRLSQPAPPSVPDIHLRIMQPSIAQDEKFSPEQSRSILGLYLSLSTKGSYPSAEGMKGITHLIWPETAFPFLLDHSPEARREIATILKNDALLLTGAVRAEDKPDRSGRYYFNAIQVLDQNSQITGSADKVHLVPFGEYLPLGDILDVIGVRDFIAAPGGFTAGKERFAIDVPHWPITLPLICYEAIFSSELQLSDQARPGVLLNVTNDAWFGQTAGPWQHFSQTRLRAIEQGVPMIRAANSGISAILDPYGRDITRLGLGERGVIDGDLPEALPPTLYFRLSATPFSTLRLFSGLIVLLFTLGQLIPRRV